jgi:hypothetical protein
MEDIDRDREQGRAKAAKAAPPARPAWVDEQDGGQLPSVRRERAVRRPVPGKHEDDGLWLHVLETGAGLAVTAWVAAVIIPHAVPLWMISAFAATITAVTWVTAVSLTNSAAMAWYLTTWGLVLTSWITAARLAGPWRGTVIFALMLPVLALTPIGVAVIRKFRDRVNRVAETGRDSANIRECRYWEGLLARLDVPGVTVRDVIKVDGGYQVHCRLAKAAEGRRVAALPDAETARRICVHKRLATGAVYIENEPLGGSAADFIIHVRSAAGPRLARFLPAENHLLSVNREFALGVLDTGREFRLKLREVVVFICGLRGSGKSTLLNVFIAQLCRMPDALVFMIDLKGGQEARAWLMPWLQGWTKRPAIDWLATTREEASIMLDALWRAGTARAESSSHGRKLRPSREFPAIIVICDETAVMTGHFLREDGISNAKLAVRLLQIAETFRSVAIDPVVAAVRAVVDVTGNSGIKAMSEVRIGMRVSTAEEGRAIFPDNPQAAKQLSQLKERGQGIPKVGAELYPPVHFYNITDGNPDDDGHPTEDRITPIVLAAADRRPEPEQLIKDSMNTVRVQIGGKDMGVYDARWEQPHIKGLLASWRADAGVPDRPEPAPRPGRPGRLPVTPQDDREMFDEIVRQDTLLRDMDPGLADDDEPGHRLHPARKRLYEMLIEAGPRGRQAGVLWTMLGNEGLTVTRQTVHEWLRQAGQKGYARQVGKPQSGRSRWIWILAEGREFDIPGMHE